MFIGHIKINALYMFRAVNVLVAMTVICTHETKMNTRADETDNISSVTLRYTLQTGGGGGYKVTRRYFWDCEIPQIVTDYRCNEKATRLSRAEMPAL